MKGKTEDRLIFSATGIFIGILIAMTIIYNTEGETKMSLDENQGRIVRMSYHRTVNLGDYNSLKIGMDIEEWIPQKDIDTGAEASLAEECKEEVLDKIKAELKRLGKLK